MTDTFTCKRCGKPFAVPAGALKRYPGWKPATCMSCRFQRAPALPDPQPAQGQNVEDPATGIFTDGACDPNPGPGGWGAVMVLEHQVQAERFGHDPATTNNRMELTALIEGYRMIGPRDALPVYSDSAYSVRTLNEWAPMWRANGWRRGKRREPVENLDLVQELLELAESRPLAVATWIRGHAGLRWNEYADALSRNYLNGDVPADHRPAPAHPGTIPLL